MECGWKELNVRVSGLQFVSIWFIKGVEQRVSELQEIVTVSQGNIFIESFFLNVYLSIILLLVLLSKYSYRRS